MTDNDIIKALEYCGNIVDSTCKECVYHETYNASCVVRLMRDSLDLIRRQKAEIERLHIEGLQINKTFMDFANKQTAKAIKEFAERVKEKTMQDIELYGSCTGYGTIENIDNLVKEMTEESENG